MVRSRWLIVILNAYFVSCFGGNVARSRSRRLFSKTNDSIRHDEIAMNFGLLISSFTDGLLPNVEATRHLQRGLVKTILLDKKIQAEHEVESSAVQSPCCGPDIPSLDKLQEIDELLAKAETDECPAELIKSLDVNIRLVYIPTAMFARRLESSRTPGKQRQRAKADARKRRSRVEALLVELMGVEVSAITLDLDDGAILNPSGSTEGSFPEKGIDALTSWHPHLVYVEGGNTFWLHHCMCKGEWQSLLRDVCTNERESVFIGSSAGAILAGKRLETATWKGWDDPRVVPGMEQADDWINISGLDLVGASIFPHMNDDWGPVIEQKQAECNNIGPLVTLRDDEAYFVSAASKASTVYSVPKRTAAVCSG